jgi:hypothetical protein
MSGFETQVCVHLAKEALAAANRVSNPELKHAVLKVAIRYAVMAEIAANKHAVLPANGWSSCTTGTEWRVRATCG